MADLGRHSSRRSRAEHDRVLHHLRSRIASGFYRPHSFLPSERQLALEMGVGRDLVCAAIDTLARDGLVEQHRGRGTRVLPPGERLGTPIVAVAHMIQEKVAPEAEILQAGILSALSRLNYKYEVIFKGLGPTSAEEIQARFGAAIFREVGLAEEEILKLHRAGVPVVVANMETDLDVSATWVDHGKTTRQAVNLLAALRHRRIVFLTRHTQRFFYKRARQGYEAGLQDAGLPLDESLIVECEQNDPLIAYLAAKPLLSARPRPTAIVATRDVLAQGAWQAAVEQGLAVGRDISIIGFDDVSWPQAVPQLTTFREPCYALGAAAVELLVDRIIHRDSPPVKRELEAPLILRGSVSMAPDADQVPLEQAHQVMLTFTGGIAASAPRDSRDAAEASPAVAAPEGEQR